MARVVLASCLLWATVSARRCCPGDEVLLMAEMHCSVSVSTRPINCSQGMYVLDPATGSELDVFSVSHDDRLLVVADGDLVDPDSYCLTHLLRKNGTPTTQEVAFVCFPDADPQASSFHATRHRVIGVLLAVSTVFLTATLVVYAVLPEMRDLEGRCLVSAVLCLLVSYVLLAAAQFHGAEYTMRVCLLSAFFLYYWMLAAFFWLNVVSCNLWRAVVRPGSSWSERRLFAGYCAWGWGCPAVFAGVAVLAHHLPGDLLLRPGFGESSCWFSGGLQTWSYFYGPVGALVAANLVLFVWTATRLWRSCSQAQPKLLSLKYKCALYCKLFVIMGITWVFELMSHVADPHSQSYVWFATDIVNSLQGVLIFVITVACRKRVLRGLARRRPCGLAVPKRWAAGVDLETDEPVHTDEVAEMSQPALEAGSPSPQHQPTLLPPSESHGHCNS